MALAVMKKPLLVYGLRVVYRPVRLFGVLDQTMRLP